MCSPGMNGFIIARDSGSLAFPSHILSCLGPGGRVESPFFVLLSEMSLHEAAMRIRSRLNAMCRENENSTIR
jgi:hypothetical protein